MVLVTSRLILNKDREAIGQEIKGLSDLVAIGAVATVGVGNTRVDCLITGVDRVRVISVNAAPDAAEVISFPHHEDISEDVGTVAEEADVAVGKEFTLTPGDDLSVMGLAMEATLVTLSKPRKVGDTIMAPEDL